MRRSRRSRSEEDGHQRPLEEDAFKENSAFTPQPIYRSFRTAMAPGLTPRGRGSPILEGRGLAATVGPAERERIVRRRVRRTVEGPGFRQFLNKPRPDRPPRREARPELVEVAPFAVAPARLAEVAAATRRLLYLTDSIADKQWRRHGPGERRPKPARTAPARWWPDIQAFLDTVRPRREGERWVYDDVERRRRLFVERDGAGRLVVAYYPPRTRRTYAQSSRGSVSEFNGPSRPLQRDPAPLSRSIPAWAGEPGLDGGPAADPPSRGLFGLSTGGATAGEGMGRAPGRIMEPGGPSPPRGARPGRRAISRSVSGSQVNDSTHRRIG